MLHENSTSIKQQSDLIKKRCKIEGRKYDPEEDLYIDEGLSGSKKEVRRPAFERLLANSGKYDRRSAADRIARAARSCSR